MSKKVKLRRTQLKQKWISLDPYNHSNNGKNSLYKLLLTFTDRRIKQFLARAERETPALWQLREWFYNHQEPEIWYKYLGDSKYIITRGSNGSLLGQVEIKPSR